MADRTAAGQVPVSASAGLPDAEEGAVPAEVREPVAAAAVAVPAGDTAVAEAAVPAWTAVALVPVAAEVDTSSQAPDTGNLPWILLLMYFSQI